MKLYATTTSERASKGQGGNEYLKIIVLNENKTQKALFDITNDEDGFILDFTNYANGVTTRLIEDKQSKVFKCFWCNNKATIKDWREIDETTGSYPSCKKCFNTSTEELLKKEQKGNKQKTADCGNCGRPAT